MLKSYHVIVAGGAISSIFTGKDINDIDMYFKTKQDLSDFLYNEMDRNWVIANTDKAFLFRKDGKKIQAIYFRYFDSAEAIFDTFDFTVCMGAYDFDKEEFVLHRDFLKHNASRILKFNANTAFPIVSALRVQKYVNKGYSISKSEFLRIMLTIANSKISTYEELKAQMGGMYGENYDNLLEPKDQEEFDIAGIVEKMKYINYDKDYFVLPQNNGIDDWDDFIYSVLQEKIKYFVYKDVRYRLVRGELEQISKPLGDKYVEVGVEDVVKFPLVRYKYVKRNPDDSLRSYWDSSFVWKVGENTAKNSYNGLYAVKASQVDSCSYCNEKDNVLLEIIVESLNDVNRIENLLDNTCDYKRVIVKRVVPEEEVKEMRERCKKDSPFCSI
jgi:hypothetical protein